MAGPGNNDMDVAMPEESDSSDDTESMDSDEDDEVFLARLMVMRPQGVPALRLADGDEDEDDDGDDPIFVPVVGRECEVTSTSEAPTDDTESEEEAGAEKPPWSTLPDLVLVHLLSLLDDGDRLSTGKVCKRWSQLFHDPSLWRQRTFQFGGGRSSRQENARAVGFARAHGPHLQCLRIHCIHPTFYTCKRFQKSMEEFFSLLSRTRYGVCRLKEFIMPQLQIDRYWRFQRLRHKLLQTVNRFLRQQPHIQAFDMSTAMLPIMPGLSLVEALARGSGRTVETLNIEDFFHPRVGPFRLLRFRNAMGAFKNLTTLHTNYNYFSEDIMEKLGKSLGPKLTHINIKVVKIDPHFHRLPGQAWRTMCKRCPRLDVHMYLEGIGDFAEVAGILNRDMPLTGLQMWSGVPGLDETWRFDQTLLNIGHSFGHCLEELSVMLENSREPIDEALLDLVQRCRRLELLDMQAVLLIPTVDSLYRLQEEHKCGLLRCHMTLENLTGVELVDLEAVNALYQDMVEERGLDFQIEANDMPMF